MFWVWFEWQLTYAEPVSTLGDEEGTFRMNEITTYFWRSMPPYWQGFAFIFDIMLEN
jgi:hypothetical protein